MSNRHYLFYHKYYEALANTVNPDYKTINRALIGESGIDSNCGVKTRDEFVLETMYPGLLAGLGYPHDIKKSGSEEGANSTDDAIRLGFSFDYVTGLPVIPGSTVKGVLRCAFKKGHTYIAEKLNVYGVSDKKTVQALEYAIFGPSVEDEGETEAVAAPIGSRDTFFDAFPLYSVGGKLLAIENITPHSKPDDGIYKGLKDPQPLKLLKIKPGVQFLFQFFIKDNELDIKGKKISVNVETKLELYKNIIIDLGIGAKTNTGFGYMKEPDSFEQIPRQNINPQPLAVVEQMAAEGICKKCGSKTGVNAKDGRVYEYCMMCSQSERRGRSYAGRISG